MVTATLSDRLAHVLADAFEDSRVVDLGPPPGSDRIGGVLVWSGFECVPHSARQAALWRELQAHLSPEELSLVSLILTVTPAEFEASTSD
jgi:hypothetical protein